jgi:hypothetical protein
MFHYFRTPKFGRSFADSSELAATQDLESRIRRDTIGSIFVTLDKDNARRSLESADGTAYRLFLNFFRDPKHYRFRKDLTPEMVASAKYQTANTLLPKRWAPRKPFDIPHIPVARLLRKSKCMSKEGPGLTCTRAHSHDR